MERNNFLFLPSFSINKINGKIDYSMGYHSSTSVVPYDECVDVEEVTELSAISEKMKDT